MDDQGKRVSWVELYLDLVFVLAVAQLAHLIVAEPAMRSVWIALGLFFTLWWTWVGFAVLYNRLGADEPVQRLLFLAASVPIGVAAVAIGPASTGDSTVFALSLAVARLVLAGAHSVTGEGRNLLRERITRACLGSAALFALSAAVPEPLRYALWAIAIGLESSAMLTEDRAAAHRLRRDHDLSALRPEDASEALDAHHFAERFGLFLIILLGEVVVEAGQASVNGHATDTAGWAVLVAAMVLAAALWWVYFDSAAAINLRVLELSGGSPTMARAIFAVGHMLPTFRAAHHRGRGRPPAGGRPAPDRLLAGLRGHRDLPHGHAGLPLLVEPRAGRRAGAAAHRDLPARAAAARAQPVRVRLAADRLDGDVRRPQHPRAARGCRGRPRALPRR
jgi:low temperature requirement protein LtrA